MEEIEYIERESVDNVLVDMLGDIENYEECSCEFTRGFERALSCAEDKIKDIFAADVRPERHGEWLYVAVDIYGVCREFAKQCSICGSEFPVSFWENNSFNFCPNCGARMDGDENDT